MKYTISFIYTTICILVAVGCTNSPNEIQYQYKLVTSFSKGLKISVDEKTPTLLYDVKLWTNGNKRYMHFVDKLNRIQFHNIDEPDDKFKIILEKEGPNGVGKIYQYFVYNPDSIYVSQHGSDKLFLVNKEGNIQKKYFYINGRSADTPESFMIKLIDNNPIGFFVQTPMGYWWDAELASFQIPSKVNLITNERKVYPFTYPKEFEEDRIADLSYSCIFLEDKDSIVFSFEMDTRLFVFSMQDLKKQVFRTRSKYISQKNIEQSPPNLSRKSLLKFSIKSTYFLKILYDPYRKLYYRFAKLGSDVDNNKSFLEQVEFPHNQIVMIYNDKFELLTEELLTPNKYVVDNSFVAKEGLYISTNHPANPEFDEDHLKFQLFNLVKNEN